MFFIAVLTLAPLVMGQYSSYNYGFHVNKPVKRQKTPQLFLVKGPSVPDSGVLPVRKEIRDLQQDEDQWTLYLLGLSMMQFTNQSSPTSWYGLTGIHGVPFQTWGGVDPTPGNELSGYCTHISVLFPTWHRPYLALYEQVLYDVIQTIAGFWPEGSQRQRFQAAAVDFRIPYWDPATRPPSGQSVLPGSVGGYSYVDIVGPNGGQRIANPLFNYGFKPLNASAFIQSPFTTWTSTMRAPTTHDSFSQSNNTLVARTLDQNRATIEQRIYNLFANYDNYSTFSNEGWIPQSNNGTYDSIESVHDTIHNIAGGFTGHMSYIPFSAFDPIFFLHHANMDRIFAMWQALYPNSWILPTPAAMNSYTTSRGEIQDGNTELTPFFSDSQGNFWTSDMVRDHTGFGYTYADVTGSGATRHSPATNKSHVIVSINRLYGQSSPSRFALQMKESKREPPPPGIVLVGNRYREWIANVRVRKQALGGPFSVHLFLGDAVGASQDWPHALNLIGTISVFAAPSGAGMKMSGGQMVSGTVPLTAELVEQVTTGALSSLHVYDVIPFLRKSLQYRVVLAGDREVATVDSLGIDVVSHIVQAPSSQDELPKWGDADTFFNVL